MKNKTINILLKIDGALIIVGGMCNIATGIANPTAVGISYIVVGIAICMMKYNGGYNKMPNEMNHAEIAEIEYCANRFGEIGNDGAKDILLRAAADERRIANGELAEVVHAHCIDKENDCLCSNCNSPNVAHGQKYCEDCGAKLDGKDDSHV